MKITLANGTTIVPENAEEMAFLLASLGIQAPPQQSVTALPVASDQANERVAEGPWTEAAAMTLMEGLGERSASYKLIELLLGANKPVGTAQAAKELGLSDAKPLGSMVGTIRRQAEAQHMPSPLISEVTPDGSRREFRLDPSFVKAALE